MINYDTNYDVLHVSIGDTSNSYGEEEPDNIVTLKDINTEKVTGYTIMNFKQMQRTKEYKKLLKLSSFHKVMSKISQV